VEPQTCRERTQQLKIEEQKGTMMQDGGNEMCKANRVRTYREGAQIGLDLGIFENLGERGGTRLLDQNALCHVRKLWIVKSNVHY